MTEEWRVIPEWPQYEVSNLGRVRTTHNSKIRKAYMSDSGRWQIAVRHPGKKSLATGVHRLMAMAFIGPAPTPKHQVAHNDGDCMNNVVSNLRWATQSENQMDRVLHGTSNRGTRQHMCRLDVEKVRTIRHLSNAGLPKVRLAERFNVSKGAIQAIIENRSWYWVTP